MRQSIPQNSASPVKIRAGAYAVVVRCGRVLMCHTKSANRMIINFPGGALEPAEAPAQGVLREFLEETGHSAKILRHLYSSNGGHTNPDYPGQRLLCHYFLVEANLPEDLTGNGADVAGFEWVEILNPPIDRMLEVDVEFCRMLPGLLSAPR